MEHLSGWIMFVAILFLIAMMASILLAWGAAETGDEDVKGFSFVCVIIAALSGTALSILAIVASASYSA